MNEILEKLDAIGAETEDALESFMGDEELYLKYVHNFPGEPTMGRLVKAIEEKDYAAAERAVHTLKGIVGNLHFTPIGDTAMDMLQKLRAQNIEGALEAYEAVKEQYRRFCDVILAG